MLERRSTLFLLCSALLGVCVSMCVRIFDDAADERAANQSVESECRIVR